MIDDHPSAKPLAVDSEQEVQLTNQSDSETDVRAVANKTTQQIWRNWVEHVDEHLSVAGMQLITDAK